MTSQIPQFREPDATKIHNVVALTYGRLGVRSTRNGRAHRQDEATEILVQREQLQHPPWRFRVGGEMFAVLSVTVYGYFLWIQISYFEDVERDAALVSSASPLRVESSCLIVLVDIDCLVKCLQLILFSPVLRVFELRKCLLWYKLSRAKIS